MTIELDATTDPKQIDLTGVNGKGKGSKLLGLYEIKDGKLHICYRGTGGSRPASFDDVSDPKTGLVSVFLLLKPTPIID